VVIVGAVSALSASYYTENRLNRTHALSIANADLYNLSYVIDALEELRKSESIDPVVQEKLEIILVTSIVGIRSINPGIDNLQGTPKNTLCRIIRYIRESGIAENGMGPNQDKVLAELATSYLKKVEPVLQEISQNSAIPYHECNDLFGIEKKYNVLK